MDNINRRALLKILSAAPVAASFALTEAEAQQAHHLAEAARQTATRTRRRLHAEVLHAGRIPDGAHPLRSDHS